MGGGKRPVSQQPKKALGIDFQGAQYGPPIPVVYGQNKVAGNCIWYGDFQAIAQQQKQSGGKGGGGSSSTTSYTYKASYQLALCEGPITGVPTVYNGTSSTTLSAVGAVLSLGTSGQAAWSHLSGSAALGYSNTAVVSFANRDLGSQASLPNDNFEVAGLKQYGGGIVDAEFSAIFTDICNDTIHGLGGVVPLGDLTQWRNYCVAAGLFVSPVYDQQDTAQSALEDLLKYGNAAAWFSEGKLKVGCYGDQTITGNGVTYTPDLTSVASLGPDDFITNGASPPVTISRTSPADALNIIRVEYKDRANTYHDSVVLASLDEDVIANGGRSDDSESVDMATTGTVASQIAWNLLQRKFYVRNNYEFKLSWRYCYLEPFDIVQLTDANTGLSAAPVRILSVEEDEHGLLDIVAEECPEGIGHAATVATQGNSGTTVDPDADPGPVAGPYLFRGPGFLVGNNKPEIWCAVTGDGNPLWAGCDVYLSHDGTSYTYVCSYARQSRYGHITNSMGVQSDPDTVSAPNVVLNGYQTQLLGGSQADADQFITLAMIDDEVMSYETPTLASGPSYNLSYLRRGGYGTAIAAHSANAPFVRLDDGILRIPVDPSQIGSTIYLKFLSVNCFGRTPRTLSGETAYQYVIGTNVELPDVPVVPDNFSALGVADGANITWTNDNPAAVGCTSIEYATSPSGPWTVLAQVGPTATAYHHAFTTGASYSYRARSRGPLISSGWSSYTATVNSTGTNVTNIATVANTANANTPTVLNPRFLDGANGWTLGAGWTVDNWPRAVHTGTGAAVTSGVVNDELIPVKPGNQIKVSALLTASGADGSCAVAVYWYDANLNPLAPAYTLATGFSVVTGTAPNTGSQLVAVAPANAAYAAAGCVAINHANGTYTADMFMLSVPLSSQDELPDGGTYGRTVNGYLSGNKPVTDFADTFHRNKNLDYVADSATYGRVATPYLNAARPLIDFTDTFHRNKNIGNVPDGGGRYAVGAVDGNSLALVDFSQAGHINKTLDHIGDGATYGRIKGASLTGNDFDFAKGGVNKTLGYVPDGGGRYGVHQVDGNGLAVIDFSQSAHVNKTLDYMPAGNSFTAIGINQTGNLLQNPTAANGSSGWTLNGWSTAAYAGSTYFGLPTVNTTSLLTSQNYPVSDMTQMTIAADFYTVTMTAGALYAQIFFYDSTGAFITQAGPAANFGAASFTRISQTIPVPSNASTWKCVGFCGGAPAGTNAILRRIRIESGSVANPFDDMGSQMGNLATVPNGGHKAYADFTDNTSGGHVGKHLDNVGDGPSGNRSAIGNADIFVSGGVNRLGLRVSGSGQQLGDSRQMPGVRVASVGSRWNNSLTVSATYTTASPAAVTLSASAGTLQMGSAPAVPYNAASASTTQARSTTVSYYLYYLDKYTGGSQTLHFSTDPNVLVSADDVIWVGEVDLTIPASGSGSGSGSRGGGDAGCPCEWMFLDAEMRVGDVQQGYMADCMDWPSRGDAKFKRMLISTDRRLEPCVRITTDAGAIYDGSESTPFDLLDGGSKLAPDMHGERVMTDHGIETVIAVESIGMQWVRRLNYGGVTFACGADAAHRIYSHNLNK